MRVGVGYSEHPDSTAAGVQAAQAAIAQAERQDPCDLVLLFSTARHHPQQLLDAVVQTVGEHPRVFGGGTVGVITNDIFGYAGDQVGVACIWLDGVGCEAFYAGGLLQSESDTGYRLGRQLADAGVTPTSPVMLFYDAVDRSGGDVRLLMATWILEGLKRGLGFLPDLTGAGLQGDHVCSPTSQFIAGEPATQHAFALTFSEDIQIDSTIMHGCRPASGYYTVTKAEGPVILEINGEPALSFMDTLLGPAITPDDYPFFLLFGINHGERWGDYDENNYASRLCLGIDKERGGIVMFEPDMVEGTEFQLMFRSLDLDYMKPKIEAMFDGLDGREPVFAMYIDCAGRCAGYGGMDMEDAVVLQQTVQGRVPLLGLYTGVEIASIGGQPRGLDWTGVFCLFSQRKKGRQPATAKAQQPAWGQGKPQVAGGAVPLHAMQHLAEQNAAKVLALDTQSIAIRHELEQKRRGFRLLAELAVSLRQAPSYESVFIPVAQRINAALNMQKTVVLTRGRRGQFTPAVLQGYSTEEKAALAGKFFDVPPDLFDPEHPALVTAEDDVARLAQLRAKLRLPFFISAPVVLQGEVVALLITGRVVEQPPFLSRLGRSDVETVQAISELLASVLVRQRLDSAEERTHIMLDAMPLCCVFWDETGRQIDCNAEALRLFGLASKEEFLQRIYDLSPELQPGGQPSAETARARVLSTFISGSARFEWEYKNVAGAIIPTEVTLVRVPRGEDYNMVGYIRDLREQQAAMAELSRARDLAEQNVRAKSEFLAAVSHEVRTPINALLAMARAVGALDVDARTRTLIEQGQRSARLLNATIESILDYSRMEAGQVELQEAPFSVRDTAEGIAQMLAKEADEKALVLRTELAADLPALVVGDAAKLEQAVFNLAANAIKFTETGEVVIRVYRGDVLHEGKVRLYFAVQDTGIGMREEQLTGVFEPLTAADTSYSRKQGGLGMGLAVSHSLARMMDGDITVSSSPGKGSTFTLGVLLSLPEEQADLPPAPQQEGLAELAGLRVLVAEDNPINQMIVEDILQAAGVQVVVVNNGLEALQALEAEPFDLIMMDIQMPEMDGLTAAAQIRANPRYRTTPILAMTANSAPEHREESRRSGMNDHLTKPIEVEEVYAALKKWARKK